MSYANFKAVLKKINLKPKGVQEITLEVSGSQLQGQLERLASMVDSNTQVEIESAIVNYIVPLNANTGKPLKTYKVDNQGVVSEVKEMKQMELPGMPQEKVKIEEEEAEVDKEIVDKFILSGMAPRYDDFPATIADIVKRRIEGESYRKLASELDISSGKIVEIIEGYREKIAPLAQKWWEWKTSKESSSDAEEKESKNKKEENSSGSSDDQSGDSDQEDEHGAA